MKKILSLIISAVLLASTVFMTASADDNTENNVCYLKPVIGSSRMQYAELYPLNLTDGNRNLRATSYFIDHFEPDELFRIDLCADYTISEVAIYTNHSTKPRNLAVDVWSNGKWVRVAQDFDIEPNEYPISYYFDEIDASYIQISTNELPYAPDDMPSENYSFTLGEVEAYHTLGISNAEKSQSYENTPRGKKDIPVPAPVNEYFFKQGLRTDTSVSPAIPENALLSFVSQYEQGKYSEQDIKYLNALYGNSASTGNSISMSGSSSFKSGTGKANAGEVKNQSGNAAENGIIQLSGKTHSVNSPQTAKKSYAYETSVDLNPILLYGGIALVAVGAAAFAVVIILSKRKK